MQLWSESSISVEGEVLLITGKCNIGMVHLNGNYEEFNDFFEDFGRLQISKADRGCGRCVDILYTDRNWLLIMSHN